MQVIQFDDSLPVSETMRLRFLVTVMRYLTSCDLTVNVLCKLINMMVFGSAVLYSRKCPMLKLVQHRGHEIKCLRERL